MSRVETSDNWFEDITRLQKRARERSEQERLQWQEAIGEPPVFEQGVGYWPDGEGGVTMIPLQKNGYHQRDARYISATEIWALKRAQGVDPKDVSQ